TLVLLSGVLCAVLWKSRPMFREAWKRPVFHRACWPFLISLASSAALYFAPGNQVRRAFFPPGSTFTAILLAGRSTTHILQFYLTHRASLLGLAVVLGWIGGMAPSLLSLARQYPVVRRYAASFDARYQRLLDHRRSGDTSEVRLDPLGSSGWLPSAEITPDPTHWRNQEVRDGMSLGFP